MRQLIARIEDDLHERLKLRAAAEHRSLNSLVRELLERGVPPADPRTLVRERAAAAGLLVVPTPKPGAPSREAAIASTRGAGQAASEALAHERARR